MERSAFNDNYPGAQLGLTLLMSFTGLFTFVSLAYLLVPAFFGVSFSQLQQLGDFTNPKNIEIAKFIQIFLSTGLFIIVPLVLAWIFSRNGFSYLKINNVPSGPKLFWVVIIIISAIPLINLIATLNAHLKLPDFMSEIEKTLLEKEKENEGVTNAFLKVNTLSGFAINLLIISIIPAIGEEFFFRGILQRILTNLTRNYHWGIVISGFVFSAIHMQFYGFFPRWLLGILFGYMFVWSGSLWLPILAHFINNTMAVIASYLINANMLDAKTIDYGSTSDVWPITVAMSVLMLFGVYRLYKTRLLPGQA